MYGRFRSPASALRPQRRMGDQIHPPARRSVGIDWVAAHRAARIDTRCREAQERAIRIARGRWRQC